jgi:hypothetical protein
MPQIVWAARPDGTIDYFNRRWHDSPACPHQNLAQGQHRPRPPSRTSPAATSWRLPQTGDPTRSIPLPRSHSHRRLPLVPQSSSCPCTMMKAKSSAGTAPADIGDQARHGADPRRSEGRQQGEGSIRRPRPSCAPLTPVLTVSLLDPRATAVCGDIRPSAGMSNWKPADRRSIVASRRGR